MSVSESCLLEYLEWFHKHCHFNIKWMGKQTQKTPFDCWVYQEIIWDTAPDVIVEIGNYRGGSTLFLANLLDSCNNGRIIAVDIDHSLIDFNHPRIEWIEGDAQALFPTVKPRIKETDRVMVIEDSCHTTENTLALLRLYGQLVSEGCYYIVEDTILQYEFVEGPKPGPLEAINEFMKENSEFVIDKQRNKFLLSYNSDGYLKRIGPRKSPLATLDLQSTGPPPRRGPTHFELIERELLELKAFIEEQGKVIRQLESKEMEVEVLKAFIEEQGKVIRHLDGKLRAIRSSKIWRTLARLRLV